MTQEEKVMKWFKNHKYLSRQQAFNNLYIYNLTAVISNLRLKGIDIVTEKVKGKNSTYGKYRLGD